MEEVLGFRALACDIACCLRDRSGDQSREQAGSVGLLAVTCHVMRDSSLSVDPCLTDSGMARDRWAGLSSGCLGHSR